MAQKWNLQDIRPTGTPKSSMREVSPRRAQQDIAPRVPKAGPQEYSNEPDIATIDVIDGNSAKRKRVFVTTIVALIILGAGFFVNVFLGGADVIVYPKLKDISVQANFTAFINPQVDELGYELLTLETTGEKQVQASGKETVSERAEGKIFIYNTKNATPQRLVKNTRFESPDGLIFKIKESVEIPAISKDASGDILPGKAVAEVFADDTGEQYNLPPSRFVIFAYKGTDQADSFYAESTAAFTGGFEGEKYIIDEDELSTAKQALHIELRDKLLAQLTEKRPAGFIVYDSAVTFVYDSLPSTEYGDSLATIKEKARLQVPIFKESEFSKFIAEKTIPDYTGDSVTLLDPKGLIFTYTQATTSVSDIAPYTAIDFTLKGNGRIVWKFDEEKLQSELISIEKNDAAAVFGTYPAISHAQAEVRPFWATTFPDSPKEIAIHIILED